jgi:hypothetical protein
VLDGRVVPELPHDASLHGLKVRQARLAFERINAAMAITDRIPRTGIGPTNERHLGAPPDRWWEPITQAPEQPDLRDVPYGVGIRIEPQAGHEADRKAQSTQLLEADVLEVATLEPIDLACRDANGTSSIRSTQSARDPRLAKLLSDGLRQLIRESDSSIKATVSARHPAIVATDSHRLLAWSCIPHAQHASSRGAPVTIGSRATTAHRCY